MSDLEAEFTRKAALDRARRTWMDRFIDGIELLAAAFIVIVALDIFVSVLLLSFFSVSILNSYDFGKLLLGMLIFRSIAATSYRGTHITGTWSGPPPARAASARSTCSPRWSCCSSCRCFSTRCG
jgi:hypothetical protein